MKTATRLIALAALLSGAFFASTASACTLAAWNGGTAGAPAAGSPVLVSRVSGLCAMRFINSIGSVKDTSPGAEATVIARFYVYAQLNSGAPTIFEAFSDDAATASLLTVTFDGTNFVFDAGGPSPSGNVTGKSGWNLVEVAWTGGASMDYWVNADANTDAKTGSVVATAGTMESVILGASTTINGTLTFDDYESHRTSAVGPLLMGDADGDGDIDVFDLIKTKNEILSVALASGQPDCNLSAVVDVFDLICTKNTILGPK